MDFKSGCLVAALLALVLIAGCGLALERIRIQVDCEARSDDCPPAFRSDSGMVVPQADMSHRLARRENEQR
jgi:hypothetical protein